MSSAEPMAIHKVAVVGPSGSLGPSVVKHLVASGFQITLITRDPAKVPTTKFPADIKVVQGDYSSAASLATAFRGHDAIIDLTNRTATEIQLRVIDATIAAQVPRLVPSCFGTGFRNARLRSFPHTAGKAKMEDYVVQKSKEGALVFTGIQTGGFLEMALEVGWFINTKGDRPTMLYDGGDRLISLTGLESIGKAVAAALKKPEETKNRFLFIHDTAVTQNKMLELARELRPQRKWDVVNKDTAEMERASWEAFNAGDRSMMTMSGFFVRGSFSEDSEAGFKHVDNALLGIEEFSDEELKAFLARYI